MLFNFLTKLRQYETKVMSTQLLIKAKASEKLLFDASVIAHEIEEKLSAYQNSSEISRINKNAGIRSVKCSALTIEILKIAIEMAEATQGKFDPTIGVLTQKGYGFGTGNEKLLSKAEKTHLKSFVNYKEIEIDGDNVFLKREGMALDLGGIGKGYAADKIISFLKQQGVKAALVSVGGEIHTYGKSWNLGIQHPRENRFLAQFTTSKKDTLVTSSGDYERYIKDTSHNHIIQPSDAESANLMSSLTLVSNDLDAGRMDALNTALIQMDFEELEAMISKYNLATIKVEKSSQVVSSSHLHKKLNSFALL